MPLLTTYALTASARRTDSFWLYSFEPTLSVWPMAMITSSATVLSLPTKSSSLALPSGFRTALSKSKKTSAAKVTFSVTGFGGGGGAGFATGGGGAAAGGGGGGGSQTCFGSRSLSHSQLAIAGVQ